jgi:hypothetical protein
MKPSFFALFKRGRYFHAPRPGKSVPIAELSPRKTDRQVNEIERFAAAAIGFCFKHDACFKRHFLRSVCGTNRFRDAELEVEPFDWADLLIRSRRPSKAYVVELKISAPLRRNQDPLHANWRRGYGKLLNEQFEGQTSVEYVVLSRLQKGSQRRNGVRNGVCWGRRFWFDLAKGFPETKLTCDLAESLEMLGVPPLLIRRTDKMKMNRRIVEFGNAGRVLFDAAAKLGLNRDYCAFDVNFDPSTGEAYVGIDVRKAPTNRTTHNHELLAQRVTPPKKSCAWFGYVSDDSDSYYLGVWFYCGKGQAAKRISDKLKSRRLPVTDCARDKTIKDAEWWNVVVSTKTHRKASDRDWFVAVFDAVGMKPVV